MIQIYNGDYRDLEINPNWNMISDLPYGQTAAVWDQNFNLEELIQKTRNLKSRIYFCSFKFAVRLFLLEKQKEFRKHIVWNKINTSNPLTVNKTLATNHENIIVFGNPVFNKQYYYGIDKDMNIIIDEERKEENVCQLSKYTSTYNPQGQKKLYTISKNNTKNLTSKSYKDIRVLGSIWNYKFSGISKIHPTEKPQTILELLTKIYTNEEDTLFDPTAGSFSLAVVAAKLNRNFIGAEISKEYFDKAKGRLDRLNIEYEEI